MSVITIGILGILAVLLAAQLKGIRGEYGVYLAASAGLVIFFYGTARLETILDAIRQIQSCIRINSVYLTALMKMVGITYVAEFSAGICRDAGFGALGSQIEIFGKLTILVLSIPILMALLETIGEFLS